MKKQIDYILEFPRRKEDYKRAKQQGAASGWYWYKIHEIFRYYPICDADSHLFYLLADSILKMDNPLLEFLEEVGAPDEIIKHLENFILSYPVSFFKECIKDKDILSLHFINKVKHDCYCAVLNYLSTNIIPAEIILRKFLGFKEEQIWRTKND